MSVIGQKVKVVAGQFELLDEHGNTHTVGGGDKDRGVLSLHAVHEEDRRARGPRSARAGAHPAKEIAMALYTGARPDGGGAAFNPTVGAANVVYEQVASRFLRLMKLRWAGGDTVNGD